MTHWLYPANTKIYDVLGAFQSGRTFWPVSSSVTAGDAVYIYLTAPQKQIGFVCNVLAVGYEESDILEKLRPYFKSAPKPGGKSKLFMELAVTASCDIGDSSPLSLPYLRTHGLNGMLMGPRKLENNPPLMKYILEQTA